MVNKMDKQNKDKAMWLKRLAGTIAAMFFLTAMTVWIMDPFYQYHGPILGKAAVLNDRDNQMPGSIRNFTYDSILVGSSVAENFDSEYLDNAYQCKTLKVIRASGSVADLLYYVNIAQERHELKNIFWCLDEFALTAPAEEKLDGDDTPRYLHTASILDDIPYLFNKEILFETIPTQLYLSRQGVNVGGDAYNWADGKNFSAAQAMLAYDRSGIPSDTIIVPRGCQEVEKQLEDNLALLDEQITSHPEITYRFIVPPYSMLWWDCAYVNGELEQRVYVTEKASERLLEHENVEIYYFQALREVVVDLDNYMDMIHYSPEINQLMLEKMTTGENRLTADNKEAFFSGLWELIEDITSSEIFRYYPDAAVLKVSGG